MSARNRPRRKKRKASSALRAKPNAWDTAESEIREWFSWFDEAPLTTAHRQALFTLGESLSRLSKHRDNLNTVRNRIPKHHGPVGGVTPTQQAQLVIASDAFFQSFHAAMSALVHFCSAFPAVFGQPPQQSFLKFVKWLASRVGIPHGGILYSSLQYRSLIDHPEAYPARDWKTVTMYGGPVQVVQFGEAARNGAIPSGSTPQNFADGLGWDYVAPYENYVFTLFSMAVRPVLWKARDWLLELEPTPSFSRELIASADTESPQGPAEPEGVFWGTITEINGASAFPHPDYKPSDEELNARYGKSFLRPEARSVADSSDLGEDAGYSEE